MHKKLEILMQCLLLVHYQHIHVEGKISSISQFHGFYSFRALAMILQYEFESIPVEYYITSLLGKIFLLLRQISSLIYNVSTSGKSIRH